MVNLMGFSVEAIAAQEEKRYFVYQDESGEPGKAKFFIVGVLVVDEPTRREVIAVTSSIREKFNFREEMHFKTMSKRRYPIYTEVMSAVATLPIRFCAMVVDNSVLDLSHFSNKRYLAYNRFTYLAIFHNIKALTGDIYIHPDGRSRIKEDNFLDYIKDQLEFDGFGSGARYEIRAVEPRDSKKEEMLQVTDLYLGAVNSMLNPPQNVQKNVLATLVRDLSRRSPRKFNIWHWKPKK